MTNTTNTTNTAKINLQINADLTSELLERVRFLLTEALASRVNDRNWITPDEYRLALAILRGERYEPMTIDEERAVSSQFRAGQWPAADRRRPGR
jgi:hypothetical protein